MKKYELLFSISLIFFIIIFLIYKLISDLWTSSRKNVLYNFLQTNSGQDNTKYLDCMINKTIDNYTYSEFKSINEEINQQKNSSHNDVLSETIQNFMKDIITFDVDCQKNNN